MKNYKCKKCGKLVIVKKVYDRFEGELCERCWIIEQEKKPLPTANELADMFRKSVNI